VKPIRYIFLITICLIISYSCQDIKSNQNQTEIDATYVIKQAYQKAGGEFWRRPESLTLIGHGVFYSGLDTFIHESHKMYRVYESEKTDAHAANGKVRIESYRNGKPIILISFDGEHTYDLNGRQEKSAADQKWASNFGYGAIRHALDEGYKIAISGKDKVNQEDTYTIEVIDQTEGKTYFDITQDKYEIVKVAFDTPKGWHYRIYSKFFKKDKYKWNQAGLVQLFYNDKLSNEIVWTDFEVNEDLPEELFVLSN